MIEHTFCHIPGIGPATESKLWAQGVRSWSDVDLGPWRGARSELMREHAKRALMALEANDARYFHREFPAREHWRLFPAFRGGAAYLDIETTGLGDVDDFVTAIALYDGTKVRTYVHGRNMEEFEIDVADYDLLITFNGKSFDIPMIRRMLRVDLDQAHIDLMYVLRGIGLRGGLKAIERRLGYDRAEMSDVDGYFAVILWREFERTRDERVLETLLAYNVQDVLNLEPLMVHAFNEKVRATPFFDLALPEPRVSPNPFKAHRDVIDRLRRPFFW